MNRLFHPLTLLLLLSSLLTGCVSSAPAPAAPQATQPPTRAPIRPTATHEPGCTVVSKQPTPTPLPDPLVPPVSKSDWTKGKPGAAVTIIDYSDFQ